MRVMQVKYNARTKMNKANSRSPFSLAVTKGNEGSCYSNPVYQSDISAGIIISQSGPTNMCSDYHLIQKAPSNQQSYGLYLKRATMGLGAGGGGIGNAKSSAGLASRVVGLPFTDPEFSRGQQQRTLTYKRPPNFTTSNYIDNKRSKALRCNILDKCRKPEKITIIIDGTSQVIYLYSNYNTLANSVSNLNSQINVLGATASIDGTNLKITSNSTGSSSTVSILSTETDNNPLALFGSTPFTLTTGLDATAGTLTGGSFTPYDFSTLGNQNLNVIVDGGNPESITISANCDTGTTSTDLDNAAAGISITGATVSVDSGNLKITSNSTGASSAIAFQTTATAGTLTGGSFTGHDFSTVSENLIVVVDGVSTTLNLNGDLQLIGAAATAITALAGASCAVSGSAPNQVLKITSGSSGATSSIAFGSGSGSNALALFGTTTTVDGVAASGANALDLFGTTSSTTGTDATSGTLTGNSFTAYDFTVIKNTWRWYKTKDGRSVYGYQDGKVCYDECGKSPIITSESKYNTSSQYIEKKLSMRVGPSLTKKYESNMMQNGGCVYLM